MKEIYLKSLFGIQDTSAYTCNMHGNCLEAFTHYTEDVSQ